eukprot:4665338-Pyramimonas_sp.AAC.1
MCNDGMPGELVIRMPWPSARQPLLMARPWAVPNASAACKLEARLCPARCAATLGVAAKPLAAFVYR